MRKEILRGLLSPHSVLAEVLADTFRFRTT
jgi:hypothetical protein